MTDYSQPDFYRFNEDSLKLVSFVLSKINHCTHLLDVCAGSGVIGIELSRRLHPETLTLLEYQEDFYDHLKINADTKTEIVISSFGEFCPDKKFDLVVMNPPYFLPGHGQRNPDPKRETARSFVKDNWTVFSDKLLHISNGRIFIVLKNDKTIIKTFQAAILNKFEMVSEEMNDLVMIELLRL